MANSVLHTPSRHTFSCDGTQRLFPIPSYIISQDYVRIEIDGVLQSDRKKWDIVNNSLVFIDAPSNGSILDVQVASDSESLGELGTLSNVDIVAQNITQVSAVGSNIAAVINVSNNINTVTEGFVEIKTVADNIASVNTNASKINDIVTVANISDKVVDVSEIKTEVVSVAGIKDKVTTVSNIESSVVGVANNETNINEVASIKTEVTTVAGIKDKIVLIKDNLEDVQNASENAINAKLDSYKSEAHRLTANSYAVEPEDTFVKIYTSNGDGTFTATNTTDYSALHWERKASTLVTEGIIDDTTPSSDMTYSSNKVQGVFDSIKQDIGGLTTTIDNISSDISNIENSVADIYKEIPTGFPNRVDSKISFDEVSRIFTIEPTVDKYSFYVEGVEFEKKVSLNVTIDDINGLWFIYFNSNGELQKSQTNFFNIPNSAYVAYIYWNSTQQKAIIFGDERHGIQMDRATHAYLHNFEGARYRNGLVIGNYTLVGTGNNDVDAQFSITNGAIQDEDIIHNIVHSNTPTNDYEQYLASHVRAPVQYRDGINGNWFTTATNDFVIKMNSGIPQYNQKTTGWSLANVPNNNYYAVWILATNNKKEPIISIVGQRVDASLEEAITNNKFSDLDFGDTALLEFKQLYRLIYQYNSSFTNQVKSALRSIVDVRGTTVRQISSTTSVSHNETTGRSEANCHPISSITDLQSILNSKEDKASITTITGTASFNSITNNINLTGIGSIGLEIGDVIQISGADDAKNNSEFTIEVITDNNNIIVNQAHANKGTTKNVATRASDTGVTVKLLAKWYDASDTLGRDWVDVTSSRNISIDYYNLTKRTYKAIIHCIGNNTTLVVGNNIFNAPVSNSTYGFLSFDITPTNKVSIDKNFLKWIELR